MLCQAFNWQLLNCEYRPNATHTCANSPQVAPGREQNASAARAQCTAWMRGWGCSGPAAAGDGRRQTAAAAAAAKGEGEKGEGQALPSVARTEMALMFGFSRVSHHHPLATVPRLPLCCAVLRLVVCLYC